MRADEFFLVAAENKDKYCLDPIAEGLKAKFRSVYSLNFFDDINDNNGSILKAFAQSRFPVAIISSAAMVNFLALIRPRGTFLCIGVEHGIAPFKSYTYGKHLLASDFYLAPTKGWADRLAKLYPEARSQVRIGGYPKIEAIKGRADLMSAKRGTGTKRILVILSWGVSEDAFQLLPDQEYIDYVLHPADYKLEPNVKLSKARLHVSSPDVTYDLISSASLVIGDFSSLTLECIYLRKHVIFMFDRSIYKGNCDLDADFFNDQSPKFGIIPESDCKITVGDSITASTFRNLIDASRGDIDEIKSKTMLARFDSSFLPPDDVNNCDYFVEEFCKLLEASEAWPDPGPYAGSDAAEVVETMCFISSSYQAILGRPADRTGLRHYLARMTQLDGTALRKVISVWNELGSSQEAMKRSVAEAQGLPRIFFPGTDPVRLAHTSAAEEKLLDALHWIGKAIENSPNDGELHRFKASILERSGRLEEALEIAKEAQLLGADADSISRDIERIEDGLVCHLKEISRCSDNGISLPASVKLLGMGRLTFPEFIKLVGKMVSTYAK